MNRDEKVGLTFLVFFLLLAGLGIFVGIQNEASWAQECRDAGGVPHDPVCYARDAVLPVER